MLGLVTLFIVAWIVDIACRPVVNPEGLKGALDARSRSKVRSDAELMLQGVEKREDSDTTRNAVLMF